MKRLYIILLTCLALMLMACAPQNSQNAPADGTTAPVGEHNDMDLGGDELVACPEDAKICPDGDTVVVREGPDCEFALCPSEVETTKEYILEDLDKCAVVIFKCEEGKQEFIDEQGCGCETVPDVPTESDSMENEMPEEEPMEPVEEEESMEDSDGKVHCTPEMKEAFACTREYMPVCGWFDESVQCITYPCAQEFSNKCEACKEAVVDHYTEGACPTSLPEEMDAEPVDAMPAEEMPQEEEEPEATPEEDDGFVQCKPEQKGAFCVQVYKPVCGYEATGTSTTYSNGCIACSEEDVVKYEDGECASVNTDSLEVAPTTTNVAQFLASFKGTLCTEQQKEAEYCIQSVEPTCGFDVNNEGTTFSNVCQACMDEDVLSWEAGECQ